jgi:hypothetical protein
MQKLPSQSESTALADRRWLAAIPFVAAIAVAAVTRRIFAFDGLYGQDAFAYFRFARAIWPHLLSGAPLPPLYWPQGYPTAVALLLPLVRASPAAGQLVNALACAVAASATFSLVRTLAARMPGRTAPLPAAMTAGLAVAFSGAVLRSSQVVMADGLGLGLAAVAMLCAVRVAVGGAGPWLVACALALACGAVTRWMIALLALPIGAYLLIVSFDPAAPPRSRRAIVGWWLVAIGAGLAVLVPQIVSAHAIPSSFEKHEWLQSWGLSNAFKRSFDTPEGHWTVRFPTSVYYFIRLGWPDYFFPTLGVFAAFGLWALWRARAQSAAVLIVGWLLVSWLFLSGVPYESARFLLPTLPAVAALVGIGAGAIWSTNARGSRWVGIGVSLSLAAGLIAGAREHMHQVERKQAELDLVRWTVERVPAEAELAMWGPTLAMEYYGNRQLYTLYSMSEGEVRTLISSPKPIFVLGDVGNIEDQWRGLGPERILTSLRRNPGLVVVDQFRAFTLFKMRESGR